VLYWLCHAFQASGYGDQAAREIQGREERKVRISKFREPQEKRYWKSGGDPLEAMNRIAGGGNE